MKRLLEIAIIVVLSVLLGYLTMYIVVSLANLNFCPEMWGKDSMIVYDVVGFILSILYAVIGLAYQYCEDV